jgi:DNA polymerase-4
VSSVAEIEQVAFALLGGVFPISKSIRLLGVSLSSLDGETAEADQPRLI